MSEKATPAIGTSSVSRTGSSSDSQSTGDVGTSEIRKCEKAERIAADKDRRRLSRRVDKAG